MSGQAECNDDHADPAAAKAQGYERYQEHGQPDALIPPDIGLVLHVIVRVDRRAGESDVAREQRIEVAIVGRQLSETAAPDARECP